MHNLYKFSIMLIKSISLLIVLQFSDIYGASPKFRFDYTFYKPAEGWLKLHRVPATWNDARLICHAEGAVLASPLTQHLQKSMVDLALQTQAVATIFTGVHSIYAKGAFTSIEGVPLLRLNFSWAPGEPDNYKNSENCLVMLTSLNGTMADARCSDVLPFICYRKKTETLVVTGCGTHDTEYNLDKRTGSCYKFHRRGLTWSLAQMTCVAEGGYLIILNSDQESAIVREIYAKNPDNLISATHPNFASVGIFNFGDGGHWMTINGQIVTELWHPGQPRNETQPLGEFCGVTDRGTGKLFDAPCNWVLPFICEKSPISLEDTEELI